MDRHYLELAEVLTDCPSESVLVPDGWEGSRLPGDVTSSLGDNEGSGIIFFAQDG